ncbi:hypothetical protein M9M90_21110 (plasmid) [Phenylobacterium sp. LH3H17]|uniref:SDH family Clp fold serine proteinase n=1 Tax=Phenylobacterium sp. LH3H17 TaxID=2903901 RepID=UPI0020C9DFFE|nr:hypothetical protein [Phenylobacterium sp. LH3H17]UTP41727.1 hypothetical protein M9M90_21110 [Phenylobacterium sp. LH3H17]
MTDKPKSGPKTSATPSAPAPAPVPPAPAKARSTSKTPLFAASHAARYQRQDLIKDLEERVPGRRLLCFVGGREAEIDRDDTAGFVDLLYHIHPGDHVDLMLHTIGGDIDAAEKLIKLVQAKVGENGTIRAIVPDFAKSAGTLMALGANTIVMSDSSELGAIDPQFYLKDGQGNDICHSVLRYLDAYRQHAEALRANPEDPVAQLMFDKFDPNLVRKFEGIRDRASTLAEDLLKRRGKPYSTIAGNLMDIARWKSHNQMISAQDAVEIGLDVEVMSSEDDIWRLYWELYCHLSLAIKAKQKVFESAFVSLVL